MCAHERPLSQVIVVERNHWLCGCEACVGTIAANPILVFCSLFTLKFPPSIHSCPWSARELRFLYVIVTGLVDVLALIQTDMCLTMKCCTLPMTVAFSQLALLRRGWTMVEFLRKDWIAANIVFEW
eukprot:4511716-Alexandrium_andersonii.AAC.1